jgi:hypothetical protein
MKEKIEKTTILFVNKKLQTLKPIQVSSGLIIHWKKYVAAVFLLFFALTSTIVYLTISSNQQYKTPALFTEADTSAVQNKFTNIDKELSAINGFLKARGIKTASKGPRGGEADHDIISTDEIIDSMKVI